MEVKVKVEVKVEVEVEELASTFGKLAELF